MCLVRTLIKTGITVGTLFSNTSIKNQLNQGFGPALYNMLTVSVFFSKESVWELLQAKIWPEDYYEELNDLSSNKGR